MNVAFFSKQLPSNEPNGVSVQVHRLAEALSQRGHQVTVFTLSPPVIPVQYKCVQLKNKPTFPILRKFTPALRFRTVDTTPFDIVHFHGDDYLCAGASNRVRTFYGSALREALHAATVGRFLYQALFYGFEWIATLKKGTSVAISKDTRRYLPRIKRCIPCCIPLDKFNPGERKSVHPSILFLGDFTSRKRGMLLLHAFTSTVLPAHPDCTLTIVGPVPCSGPGIRYAGRIAEERLIAEYQRSWIFCMPSSYEGFGVPLLEAMACGCAVAATHNPGSIDLVQDGENGLLCRSEELGDVLNRLIEESDVRASLCKEGLKCVRSYDTTEIAKRYERIYREIAK
jgi:glycosyltransferase involved in cell wall biosynthesis